MKQSALFFTFPMKILIFALLFFSFSLLYFVTSSVKATVSTPSASNSSSSVCPRGDVKVEIDGSKVEYTNNNATFITFNTRTLSWTVADGYKIDSICIKIGKGGVDEFLLYPNASSGTFTLNPEQHDISHAVLYTSRIPPFPTLTPVPCNCSPTPSPRVSPYPSPIPSPIPSPTPTETPVASPQPSPQPSPSPTATPVASPTPSPGTSPTPTPVLTPTPSPSPATSPTPTPGITPSPAPTPTVSPTPSSPTPSSPTPSSPTPSSPTPSSPTPSTPSPSTTTPTPGIGGPAATPDILGVQDEFNPLLEGLKFGLKDILGVTTWPSTGLVDESVANLPNNLQVTNAKLTLPSLQQEWSIYQGEQIGQDWIVGDTEVSRLPTTKGTVLYGHNTDAVFGRIHTLAWGATAQLENGQETKTYRLARSRVINSDYTPLEKIEYADGELTLITCRDADSPLRVIFTFEQIQSEE